MYDAFKAFARTPAIEARAARLAAWAAEVWPFPNVPEAALAGQRKPVRRRAYGIEDHPYLTAEGPAKILYEALRSELLAIDPCVTEEFLRVYVAFKAESNFVDVAPLKSSLHLTFNLPFPDVVDPRGLAVDMTGRNRWGNGDVVVRLKRLEDIPYVMSLARQAFEAQMGGDDGGA